MSALLLAVGKPFLAGSAALPQARPSRSCCGGQGAVQARGVRAQAPSEAQELLERAADKGQQGGGEAFDARAFRRSLNATGRYTRKPSNDPASLTLMEEHGVGYSTAGLVAQMREQGNVWRQGDVTVKLAQAYGFCWGVERAVQMAYEARRAYPSQRLHITNEIIHNPGAPLCWRGGGLPRRPARLDTVRCGGGGGLTAPSLPVCGVRVRREPAAQGDGCAVH